ncbi:MAG: hypothetical protein IKN11_02510 [Bacteroidales bacterium]|nr:hypothetical protein [Bacteroidales bacterium]
MVITRGQRLGRRIKERHGTAAVTLVFVFSGKVYTACPHMRLAAAVEDGEGLVLNARR